MQLRRAIAEETGKPFFEIEVQELDAAELVLKYFTRNAHRILKDQAAPRPWILFNKRAFVRYLPRGVVAVCTPWNYPVLIPLSDALPALIAGNAVMLKPSEWATETALILEEAAKVSGVFPEGLFQVIRGDASVGACVLEHADMIVFTGGFLSGQAVAKAAAERLKPAVLELGGKHPMIVLRDAAIARAAKAAVWGRLSNSGQSCVAVERVYVEESIYDSFIEAVTGEMAALRQGLDGGYEIDLGRLIHRGRMEEVLSRLEEARGQGARVLGGEVIDASRCLMAPALVLDAPADSRLMREEIFGPVLPVSAVRSAEEAVLLANDGHYALSASIWSRDVSRAEALSARLEAGVVGVNDLPNFSAVCSLPFGGFKRSGLGRRFADEGLRMFCETQSVLVHEWPAALPELWWFPYRKWKNRLLGVLTRWS